MKKYISIFLTLIIAGCASKTITEVRTEVISVPTELIEPTIVNTPPNKEVYINSTYQEKEDILINYSIELIGNINSCNNDKVLIKEHIAKQELLLKKDNK